MDDVNSPLPAPDEHLLTGQRHRSGVRFARSRRQRMIATSSAPPRVIEPIPGMPSGALQSRS